MPACWLSRQEKLHTLTAAGEVLAAAGDPAEVVGEAVALALAVAVMDVAGDYSATLPCEIFWLELEAVLVTDWPTLETASPMFSIDAPCDQRCLDATVAGVLAVDQMAARAAGEVTAAGAALVAGEAMEAGAVEVHWPQVRLGLIPDMSHFPPELLEHRQFMTQLCWRIQV